MDLLPTQIQGLFRIGLFISALAAEVLFIVITRLLGIIPTKVLLIGIALIGCWSSDAIVGPRGFIISVIFWRDGL